MDQLACWGFFQEMLDSEKRQMMVDGNKFKI